MNRTGFPPASKFIRRARWFLFALLALAPLALLSQSQRAQKYGAGGKEKSAAAVRRGPGGGGDKTVVDETKRRLAAARAKAPRESGSGPRPITARADGFAVSRPLSEVAKREPKASPRKSRAEEEEEERNKAPRNKVTRVVTPQAKAAADEAAARGAKRDTALQQSMPEPNMPPPTLSFEGLGRAENIAAGFGNFSPPDTNGDVGPNHYVQMDNLLVRVWNKAGTPLTAPFKLSSLFAPLGGQCAQPDRGDPIVLYDQLADRWMLSQFAFANQSAPPYHECIAVSKTGDPTGAYYLYDFVTPGNEFPDYPHFGVWPDGYYMMVHQFTNGGSFNGTGAYSFDRVKMLAGDPAAGYIYFNLSRAAFPEAIGGMLPSDLDGMTPPPAGRPNTFIYFTTPDFNDPANGIRLFDFHADYTTPANSTFAERAESTYAVPLAVAPFSIVTPQGGLEGRAAVPQPPPTTAATGLDAISDRLMHRLQYRNRGGFETLVTTHTVGAPASTAFGTYRAAPRYYELRSNAGGPFVVHEQATFAPADGVSRWMGSAAADNQGNLAVGYNASSRTVYPGIRYAGRLATDPPGGLGQGETTLIDGTGVQTSVGNRWGDYSALTVDPSDDCTFWYTGEYYTAAGQAASPVGWQTRIGSFKFAQCTAPAKGTARFTVTNCTSAATIPNAVVTIDGVPYGVTAADGTYDATLAPGAHAYSITKPGGSVAAGTFNVAEGNTTNVSDCIRGGTAHFVVTDCTSAASVGGAAVSVDGTAAGFTSAAGALDVALVPGSHGYTVSKVGYAPTSNSFDIADGDTTNVSPCLQGVPSMAADGASLNVDTNANGAVDPGETVTVGFGLKNIGAGATTDLVATLQATGGVTSPGAPASYGRIDGGGGTATRPISFTADAGLACGSTLTATLHLRDGATDLGNVTYNFTICPIVIITATAGTVGPTAYPTLKAAFDAVNAGTHQGAVTVSINASTTEGTTPATLNGSGAGPASYTSVLIRPVSDGVSVGGNPAGGLGVIQLNGASNVTIDGDNPNTAGTNRNLTVQNTAPNTANYTSVVRIALATTGATTADNDTIKNLNVLGSATGRNVSGATSPAGSQNTTYGIYVGANSAGVTAAPSPITSVSATVGSPARAGNLLIQNNSVNTAARAVAVQGSATTVFPGLLIRDNVIGNPTALAADQVYSAGILASGTADGRIIGNTVHVEGFVASSSAGVGQAISLGTLSSATTLRVEKNRVARVHNRAPDTWPAIGINLGGGNNHVVQNNFVYDIKNDQTEGFGGGGTGFGAYGIRVATGGGHKVYHNSVHLFGTLPGAIGTDLTAAFMVVSSSQRDLDVRNNVFSNQMTGGNPTSTNTRHTVVFLPQGASSTMNLTLNNNAYFQGPAVEGALSLLAKVGETAGTGEFLAADFAAGAVTPAANLRSYTSKLSAAGTNDNASLATTVSPQFASDTDLHIPGGVTTPLESAGHAAGVDDDIDGQTRPGPPGSVGGGGTAPDLGADEFDGRPSVAPPTPTPTPTPVPTPTPIQIVVNDARESEPASATRRMLFTVALSQTAPSGGISVNYATASGGATNATGGASCDGTSDYVTTAGTLVVPEGSRLGVVPVTVCADNAAAEPDETLTLNISGATSAAIADAQATGTITAANTPGAFIISELRTTGPAGAGDDFVELYNNTDSPLTVVASDTSAGYGVFKMGADCNATPVLAATIPNGAVIPARGHYLLTGSAYSLDSYAAGDRTLNSDIGDDQNVAVFSTTNVANLSTVTRLDGVGFGANVNAGSAGSAARRPAGKGVRVGVLDAARPNGVCDLLREGDGLPAVSGSTTEHSFFRKECDYVSGVGCAANGNPKDSNDNNADFMFADTQGTFLPGVAQSLGAPGPENLFSPIRRDTSGIGASLLDGSAASSSHPNRTRSLTSNPGQNSTFGTLTIRRRVLNSTGGNVTRLRFRIIDLTTFPSAGGGQADLRAVSSVTASVGPVGDAATCTASGAGSPPCTVTVYGTTLQEPPAQSNGGGRNSTLSVGTITTGTPLADGASLNVQFVLGIEMTGTFRFYIIVEALP